MSHDLARKQELTRLYLSGRTMTKELCGPLAIEDYVVQSSDDVSPPKWHLAHTTWFFETFLLVPHLPNYKIYDSSFHHLFNSYYYQIGNPFPRVRRGLLSRPTVEVIYKYREYVDKNLVELINTCDESKLQAIATLITLGLHHEQQHQELLLMDIKHNFSLHPNFPAYQTNSIENQKKAVMPLKFIDIAGGLADIGHKDNTFCYDNELPRHKQFLQSYALAGRLVTNGEYLEFILSNGYKKPQWWLSDGWDAVQKNHWQAPLYWYHLNSKWYIYTLTGLKELNLNEPVVHVSYYEADAYARWAKFRLPTEAEWEYFVETNKINSQEGNFLNSTLFHPSASSNSSSQFFGDVWEWTSSPYGAYPGYKSAEGALGEYNGKFMSNQIVLRGGCCITPQSHIRASYRNFFQPDKRWQFGGIRLACDI